MRSLIIQRCSVALSLLGVLMLPRPALAVPPADGWVIWQSNRQDARHEVYRARADGSEVTRMTQTGGLVPAWAPDGRWILYHDDSNTIYLMRPDGSELQVLAAGWPCFWRARPSARSSSMAWGYGQPYTALAAAIRTRPWGTTCRWPGTSP